MWIRPRAHPRVRGEHDRYLLLYLLGSAHPRVRGEHMYRSNTLKSSVGSSPRPRGAPLVMSGPPTRPGLIPASAGSTPGKTPRISTMGAHPRVRGEHVGGEVLRPVHRGSSPRPRGARLPAVPVAHRYGLIPASAGSTRTFSASSRVSGAHPRVRGEHRSGERVVRLCEGSSPRPRGAPNELRGVRDHTGLIPASAGSTRSQ